MGVLRVELAEVAALVLQAGVGEPDAHSTRGELLQLESLVLESYSEEGFNLGASGLKTATLQDRRSPLLSPRHGLFNCLFPWEPIPAPPHPPRPPQDHESKVSQPCSPSEV